MNEYAYFLLDGVLEAFIWRGNRDSNIGVQLTISGGFVIMNILIFGKAVMI